MPRKGKPIPEGTQMTRRQMDNARLSIKTGMLITRLHDNFEGKLDEPLSPTQVKSAQILLDRVLPVLSATEVKDVSPNYGNPHDIRRQLNELIAERLAGAGLNQETIDAVLKGKKPQPVEQPAALPEPTAETPTLTHGQRAHRSAVDADLARSKLNS